MYLDVESSVVAFQFEVYGCRAARFQWAGWRAAAAGENHEHSSSSRHRGLHQEEAGHRWDIIQHLWEHYNIVFYHTESHPDIYKWILMFCFAAKAMSEY